MVSRRFYPIVVTYVLSLLVAIALLVAWVVYIVTSTTRVERLAAHVGVAEPGNLPWIVLAVGCLLFALLLGGLTHQLAAAIAARRYLLKQDEFISNITHELKSPLAAIQLHAQTLQQPDLGPGHHQRSVASILDQSRRMQRLIDNMLESSRLMARKQRLELHPVALEPFLHEYVEQARQRVESRGVVLRAEIGTRSSVLATEEALERVLDNLIGNAVRFSHAGGEVRCRAHDENGRAVIAVEDDGTGIPKRELPRIFDRFYQGGRSSDQRRAGTGLGLAIVAGLVGEMRGTVRAYSQEGGPGTRFVVELPRTATAEAVADAESPARGRA
ncbi:MAG TPA: HAMP domain-containing sensor histidine kinase [Thermoanaerobaculia bacterium]|nr:HAMP domain-containing sensor histidine kinase [Thermoanaerobaculia bacterium]